MKRGLFAILALWQVIAPLPLSAQQPVVPVIGFLNSASPEVFAPYVAAFKQGLAEAGYVEGRNVAIEYRWAHGRYDQLPDLAADLVSRRVAVIVATGGEPSALAAKAATSAIPIVFGVGGDVVKLGLVTSLGRPGGNATGVSLLTTEIEAKRLEILHEIVPGASTVAALINPRNANAERQVRQVEEAARATGQGAVIFKASTEHEFEDAFEAMPRAKVGGLLVASDPFFNSSRARLVTLAQVNRLPAIYEWREFVLAGGLVSYGTSLIAAYRQFAAYTARILAGAKAAELPVVQPTLFELVINLKTAKALGIEISPALLARADEVIE